MTFLRVGYLCLIPVLGPGKWKIVGETEREFRVTKEDGSAMRSVFKYHCHHLPIKEHIQMVQSHQAAQAAAIDRIGRVEHPKKNRKKR